MADVQFDIESLTLGEALAAEEASGLDLSALLGSTTHRLLLAVFVQHLRSSGQPPNWQELTSRRLLDTSAGRSRSTAASQSAKSSD